MCINRLYIPKIFVLLTNTHLTHGASTMSKNITKEKSRRYSPALYSYISYYFSKLCSSFSLCPFNSFCFSYKSFLSSHNIFIRSNFSLIPSRHSDSICLYSPVRLRILLLFSFICSETHIQSIKSVPLYLFHKALFPLKSSYRAAPLLSFPYLSCSPSTFIPEKFSRQRFCHSFIVALLQIALNNRTKHTFYHIRLYITIDLQLSRQRHCNILYRLVV